MMDLGLFRDKRYVFDTATTIFQFDDEFNGFELGDGYITLHVTNSFYENELFYTHEFSELALMGAIRKCTWKWRHEVKFKHFTASKVAHLINPYGYPNKCTLCPDPNIRKVYISLKHRLSKEELEIREMVGLEW